ncbi:16S rRNA (uracil(1498)-N(3))-methyltransferase [Curvibacter sp. CHRR-16]|uniref:16S rRNA (uracil(1498)-N(3))-methyltransferase n=1 Tax=Curvibacter sp. CHRR-16 TaxID=2835872 RepID=UPI001BD9A49D|nr:16S rRNA (uracil(1498)-N(3))-methyltransferase [Curvibacter sp. CHRR-16]MBT0570344.1 16S rRNA (uracil(1498)-N(3))-methyltransferase [Curvibacter sp. CHRR-16]
MPRFYCDTPLQAQHTLDLPASAVRHVQVLRMQPGQTITLFNGLEPYGQWEAEILSMGRSSVQVRVDSFTPTDTDTTRSVTLAVGMPANERMDWLVEKAAELGVHAIQPLMTERTVLRLSAERSEKKQQHWQSIAIAACEQCGGNRVPTVLPVRTLAQWLPTVAPSGNQGTPPLHALLSLADGSQPLARCLSAQAPSQRLLFLSGPEGGLSPAEEALALQHGFAPVSLGARVLRAETAALAALTLATQA